VLEDRERASFGRLTLLTLSARPLTPSRPMLMEGKTGLERWVAGCQQSGSLLT